MPPRRKVHRLYDIPGFPCPPRPPVITGRWWTGDPPWQRVCMMVGASTIMRGYDSCGMSPYPQWPRDGAPRGRNARCHTNAAGGQPEFRAGLPGNADRLHQHVGRQPADRQELAEFSTRFLDMTPLGDAADGKMPVAKARHPLGPTLDERPGRTKRPPRAWRISSARTRSACPPCRNDCRAALRHLGVLGVQSCIAPCGG